MQPIVLQKGDDVPVSAFCADLDGARDGAHEFADRTRGKLASLSAPALCEAVDELERLSEPIARADAPLQSAGVYTAEQKYLFNLFKERRSVRKFKSTPVPEDPVE